MWFKEVESSTSASTHEMIITMFFLPLYLCLIHYYLTKKYFKLSYAFIINALIIISCVCLSSYLHFKNWADSIGSWDRPDSGTISLMAFERTVGSGLSLLVLGIIVSHERSKNKKTVSSNNLSDKDTLL